MPAPRGNCNAAKNKAACKAKKGSSTKGGWGLTGRYKKSQQESLYKQIKLYTGAQHLSSRRRVGTASLKHAQNYFASRSRRYKSMFL